MTDQIQIDQNATNMVRQAVTDFIVTLPPSARATMEEYFRQVLPRCWVLPPQPEPQPEPQPQTPGETP